jgi:hypothetical protein
MSSYWQLRNFEWIGKEGKVLPWKAPKAARHIKPETKQALGFILGI